MTDTPQGNSEIADYRLAVERHLLDLPEPIREDLLNGLEEHLAEVAAEREADMTLEDLLGSPEAYARELRETVEVRREGMGERFRRKVVEPLAGRSKGTAQRFTTSAGVGDAAEFRKALKPGWWVLRGVLAAMLVSFIAITIDGGMQHFYGEFAPFTASAVVALTLLCVWLSLRLGVRSERWSRNYQRLVSVAGAGLLAIVAWGLYWGLMPELAGPVMDSAGVDAYFEEEPYPGVQDIYPYTEDGEPLTDVYLFDQNGDPLWLGDPDMCPGAMPEDYLGEGPEFETEPAAPDPFDRTPDQNEYGYLYPLCGPEEDPASESPTPGDAATTIEPTSEPGEGEETTESGEDATPSPEPTE